MKHACLIALIALVLHAPAALADAVPPPPTSCPPGASGQTSHNGEWCAPTTCNADADCAHYEGGKRVCVAQALCVERREEKSASGWSHGQPFTRELAHASCDPKGAACALGSCVEAKRCVSADAKPEPKPEPTPEPKAETATSAPPAKKACSGGMTPGLFGLVLGALALMRRRV